MLVLSDIADQPTQLGSEHVEDAGDRALFDLGSVFELRSRLGLLHGRGVGAIEADSPLSHLGRAFRNLVLLDIAIHGAIKGQRALLSKLVGELLAVLWLHDIGI